MRTIAVANQKGGVGKTTVTWNLAAELGARGLRVLAVDLDSQCNLTKGVGFHNVDPRRTIYQVLIYGAHPEDVIVTSSRTDKAGVVIENRFDLIPGSRSLTASDPELLGGVAREVRLKDALALVADRYDVALLDCPPALELPTLNGLAAADEVLVPVQAQQWSYEGLGELQQSIQKIRRLNEDVHIRRIVPSIVTASRSVEKAIVEAVREYAEQLGAVLEAPIANSARVAETPNAHLPLREYDRSNPAIDGFERLADSIASELR